MKEEEKKKEKRGKKDKKEEMGPAWSWSLPIRSTSGIEPRKRRKGK